MSNPAVIQSTPVTDLSPVALGRLSAEPLVSVLISNYNYAHLAPVAIESVLSQTYQRLEVVLCDDGSTDNSLEVLERYAQRDPRVKVLAKTNGGQATGFNLAYRHSRGDILCFLDTDDAYMPHKIESVVRAFAASPEAGCVIHRLLRVDGQRRPQGAQPLRAGLPRGWHGPELLKTGGPLAYMPPTSALSFRREITEVMFPVPEYVPLNMCPDQVMMWSGPLLTPVAALTEPLAEARLHENNTYRRAGLTLESITRELLIGKHLWLAQRELLDRLAPGLGSQLSPSECDSGTITLQYIFSRLAGKADIDARYRALMDTYRKRHDGFQWYWMLSRHWPVKLFERGVNLLLGQNLLKQALGRLLDKWH